MTTSMTIMGGIALFQPHAQTPYTDALHRFTDANEHVWNPMIFIPWGVQKAQCAYCGQQDLSVQAGKIMKIRCENHGRSLGENTVSLSYITLVCPIKPEQWNGFKKHLGAMSQWKSVTHYEGTFYDTNYNIEEEM